MKIAITGAHRVGKSSLAEKLMESLSDYDFQPEPYFELEERGYVFSEIPTADDYLEQFEYSLIQISTSVENTIFDRCPIDLLAYIEAVKAFENMQTNYQKVQNVITEIDLLVFIPIESPDLISCPQSELPELRDQVNEILSEWVWNFPVDTIEVTGTLLARRDQVLKKLNQIKI